jgi:hypothetical protein
MSLAQFTRQYHLDDQPVELHDPDPQGSAHQPQTPYPPYKPPAGTGPAGPPPKHNRPEVPFLSTGIPEAPWYKHSSNKSAAQLHADHGGTVGDWYGVVVERLKEHILIARRAPGRDISAQDFGNYRDMEKSLRNIPAMRHHHHHFREMLLELFGRRADVIKDAIACDFNVFPIDPVSTGIMKFRIELTRRMWQEAAKLEQADEDAAEAAEREGIKARLRSERLQRQYQARADAKAEKEARRAAHEAKRADNQRKRDEKEANKSLARASRHAAQSGESPSGDSARTREVQGTSRGLDANNAATPAVTGVVQSSSSASEVIPSGARDHTQCADSFTSPKLSGSESGSADSEAVCMAPADSEASPLKLLSGPGSDAPLSLIAAS